MLKASELFTLQHSLAGEYLSDFEYPWQTLQRTGKIIEQIGKSLSDGEYDEISPYVWVHKKAKVAPTAFIGAPAIIGAGTEVRHCAFIRGKALIGENCVVGNSTEIKNAILFDGVQVPHYNYVGDSILGFKAHLGAGAVTSNVKSDRTIICVNDGEEKTSTGLKKLGAILGDGVEVGCNSVLNPGTVIGKNSNIYPLSSVRGVVPENSIYKGRDSIVTKINLGE